MTIPEVDDLAAPLDALLIDGAFGPLRPGRGRCAALFLVGFARRIGAKRVHAVALGLAAVALMA